MKTDSQIQADVIEELKWDPSVTHEHIGVAVSNGIVTLSGTVPSYAEKWTAEKAAQRVAGAKVVVEDIKVKFFDSYKKDDQDIAAAILNQFKWNIQIPEDQLKVSVEDGWVGLTGEVEWEYQRAAAENAVRNLTGVQGVSNNIKLKAKKIQPSVVKHKIEEALKREAEREARRISVEVRDNKVILTGKVHSNAEREDAKWAAWSAPGVTTVENNLSISP